MKRRTFFIGAGAVTATSLISVGAFNYWLEYEEDVETFAHPFLHEFLADESLEGIKKDSKENLDVANNVENKDEARIKEEIIADFNTNTIQISDGWVLSETEIAYLLKQK